MQYDSQDLKNRTEIIRNLVQTAAILIAGGWIMFEWNQTIFPNEERERAAFKRKEYISSAKNRIDLKVEAQDFCVASLESRGVGPESYDAESEYRPHQAVISATIRLINEKSYPILYELESVSAGIRYHFQENPDAKASWLSIPLQPNGESFGRRFESSNILEPGAVASLNFFQVTEPLFSDEPKERKSGFVRMEFIISARAIDTADSTVIDGSLKEKYLRVIRHADRYDSISRCKIAGGDGPFTGSVSGNTDQ